MQAPGISSYPVDWQQKISEKILEEQIITDLNSKLKLGQDARLIVQNWDQTENPKRPPGLIHITKSLEVLHHASSCEGSGLVVGYVGCWVLRVGCRKLEFCRSHLLNVRRALSSCVSTIVSDLCGELTLAFGGT